LPHNNRNFRTLLKVLRKQVGVALMKLNPDGAAVKADAK
jgi:hypothetical protein